MVRYFWGARGVTTPPSQTPDFSPEPRLLRFLYARGLPSSSWIGHSSRLLAWDGQIHRFSAERRSRIARLLYSPGTTPRRTFTGTLPRETAPGVPGESRRLTCHLSDSQPRSQQQQPRQTTEQSAVGAGVRQLMVRRVRATRRLRTRRRGGGCGCRRHR